MKIFCFKLKNDSAEKRPNEVVDQEIQELVARINDLEAKLKSEKSNSIELESKLESIQDETHQLLLEKKQNQNKFRKFNDEILLLRQDQLEV